MFTVTAATKSHHIKKNKYIIYLLVLSFERTSGTGISTVYVEKPGDHVEGQG
jgi:hypothetical protein